MREQFPQKISAYTIVQCQEYLSKYPNGLNAESVKKRLETLTALTPPNVNHKDNKENNNVNHDTAFTKIENSNTSTNSANNSDGVKAWQVIIGIIVAIGVIALSIALWGWLIGTFPILAGIIGIIYVIRNIINN